MQYEELITNAYNSGFDVIGNACLIGYANNKIYVAGFTNKECTEIQIDDFNKDYEPLLDEQYTLQIANILYKKFENNDEKRIAPNIQQIIKLEQIVRERIGA